MCGCVGHQGQWAKYWIIPRVGDKELPHVVHQLASCSLLNSYVRILIAGKAISGVLHLFECVKYTELKKKKIQKRSFVTFVQTTNCCEMLLNETRE